MNKPASIDEYISGFPEETQKLLLQIRAIIKAAAPDAMETISYGMPAFKTRKILVYFAGHKNHIGFYPTGSGIAAFKDELSGYEHSKGAIRFPLDQPLPAGLITRVVLYRLKETA